MRRILGLLICTPLLGGATCGKTTSPTTEIVELPVRQFRTLDPALTAPCGEKVTGPLSEILDIAKIREMYRADCDLRMAKIRKLQPLVEDKPAD